MHSRVLSSPSLSLWTRATANFLLLTFVVGVVGCGSKGPKNSVSGKVTLNGKAVSGTVTFVGGDGKEASVPIGPDGSYTLPDPPSGQVKVMVKGFANMPGGGPKDKMPEMPGGGAPPALAAPPPLKYASPDNGLTFNVTGGKQTFDIPLTP